MPQLLLDALGAAAQVADAHRAAGRAAPRHRRRGAAVVAAQRHDRGVEDERPLALRADLDVAAVAAEHDAGRAAPVDEQDGALAGRPVEGRERGRQGCRDQAAIALRQLGAQVHELHGHRAARATAVQAQVAQASLASQPDAHDVRRGGAEDDRGGGQPAQHERHVARLVRGVRSDL